MTNEIEFKFGTTEVKPVSSSIDRLTMLLWGLSGCGKTVLLSTLPGKKLWLQFDSDGTASIGDRQDIIVADFAKAENSIVDDFMERGIYEQQFNSFFAKYPEVESVVFDSVTAFGNKALTHGIVSGKADGKGWKASLAVPGMQGYGIRNRYVLGAVNMMLRLTAKHKKHFAIVCHEDVPVKDDKGTPISITMLLGGSLPQEVSLQISEVWHMKDVGDKNNRNVRVRAFGVYSPMRSRIFNIGDHGLINWKYDQATDTGMKIADYYAKWRDGGFKKLPLPT